MTKKVATTASQSFAISGSLKPDSKTNNESVTATPSAMASTPQLTVTHEEMHLAVNEAVAKALLEAKLHTFPRIVNDAIKKERTEAQKTTKTAINDAVNATVEKQRAEAQKTTKAAVKEAVNAAVQKQQTEAKKAMQAAVNDAASIATQKQRADAQKIMQAAIKEAVNAAVQKQQTEIKKTVQAAVNDAIGTAIQKQRAEAQKSVQATVKDAANTAVQKQEVAAQKTTQAAIKDAVNTAIHKQRPGVQEATHSSSEEAMDSITQDLTVKLQPVLETVFKDAVNAPFVELRQNVQEAIKEVVLYTQKTVESAAKSSKEMVEEQVCKQMGDLQTLFTGDIMNTVKVEFADQKQSIEAVIEDLKDAREALQKTSVMAEEANKQPAAVSVEAIQAAFKETITATFAEMKEYDEVRADLEQDLKNCNANFEELEEDHRNCPDVKYALHKEVSELKEKIKAMDTEHESEKKKSAVDIRNKDLVIQRLREEVEQMRTQLQQASSEKRELIGAAQHNDFTLRATKESFPAVQGKQLPSWSAGPVEGVCFKLSLVGSGYCLRMGPRRLRRDSQKGISRAVQRLYKVDTLVLWFSFPGRSRWWYSLWWTGSLVIPH